MLKSISKCICVMSLSVILSVTPSFAKAAELKTVFFSTMWGAMIGTVTGIAVWAIQNDEADGDVLAKTTVRGAALGIFFGFGYGLYEVNREDSFVDSAIHYDFQKRQLTLSKDVIFASVVNGTMSSKGDYSMSLIKVIY